MAKPLHDELYLRRKNIYKKIEVQYVGTNSHDMHTYIIKRDGKYYQTSILSDMLSDKKILPYLEGCIDNDVMYIWLVVPEDHPDIKKSGKATEVCEQYLLWCRIIELSLVQVTALLL